MPSTPSALRDLPSDLQAVHYQPAIPAMDFMAFFGNHASFLDPKAAKKVSAHCPSPILRQAVLPYSVPMT